MGGSLASNPPPRECSILSLQISDLPSLWRRCDRSGEPAPRAEASFVWVLDRTPQFFGQVPNTLSHHHHSNAPADEFLLHDDKSR